MKFQICKDTVVETISDDMNLRDIIKSKVKSVGREDNDDAFYIGDIGDIINKIKKFKKHLPNVEPFYAVKCNNGPAVLDILSRHGLGFDCASKGEIQTILNLGVSPDRIIFAHTCKQPSHLRFAAAKNVSMITFDNEKELQKIKSLYPDARCVIRICVDDSKSLCPLNIKFGVPQEKTKSLLEVAKQLHLNVVGVSFHVGSHCIDPFAFYDAVATARNVFNEGISLGFNFTLLDIGGGFPGDNTAKITFEETADQLNRAFAQYFPASCGVRIIAEPGRFFTSSAFTAVCQIVAMRSITSEDTKDNTDQKEVLVYYANDSIFGSFNCFLTQAVEPIPMPLEPSEGRKFCPSTIWGQTCAPVDCILKSTLLPEMDIGDWIFFENMGAYALAVATPFNGFLKPHIYYVVSETHAPALHQLYQTMKER